MALAAESAAVAAEAQKNDNPDDVAARSRATGAVVISHVAAAETAATAAKQKNQKDNIASAVAS